VEIGVPTELAIHTCLPLVTAVIHVMRHLEPIPEPATKVKVSPALVITALEAVPAAS